MVSTEVITGGTQLEDGLVCWISHTSGTLAGTVGSLGSADALTWKLYLGPLQHGSLRAFGHLLWQFSTLRVSVPLKPPNCKLQGFPEQTLGVPESHLCLIPLAKQGNKTRPGFPERRLKIPLLGRRSKGFAIFFTSQPFHYFMLGLHPQGPVSLLCRLHNAIPHYHTGSAVPHMYSRDLAPL